MNSLSLRTTKVPQEVGSNPPKHAAKRMVLAPQRAKFPNSAPQTHDSVQISQCLAAFSGPKTSAKVKSGRLAKVIPAFRLVRKFGFLLTGFFRRIYSYDMGNNTQSNHAKSLSKLLFDSVRRKLPDFTNKTHNVWLPIAQSDDSRQISFQEKSFCRTQASNPGASAL